MEELDPKSCRLLKKLNKEIDWIKLPNSREIRELINKGFVDAETKTEIETVGDWPLFDTRITGNYKINDCGKTFILNNQQATQRRWIPIAISILALVISIIALLKP